MESNLNRAAFTARMLLALPLLIFGLDGLLAYLPADAYPEHGAKATKFLEGVMQTGYLWELLKLLEVGAGIALLSGKFVPLALVVLVPVHVNILAFHVTMEPEGTWLAVYLLVLQGFLAWAYRHHLRPLLTFDARPSSSRIDD